MILMNKNNRLIRLITPVFVLLMFTGCKVYTFNDAITPADVKTVKIGFFENRARYVNPQLSPKLTDKVQVKITSQTKLTRTNTDDAHYIFSGTITNYDPSQTVGVSAQQASTNRLTVTVHVVLEAVLVDCRRIAFFRCPYYTSLRKDNKLLIGGNSRCRRTPP